MKIERKGKLLWQEWSKQDWPDFLVAGRMDEYLKRVYWGNTVQEYLYVAGAIIAAWIVLQLVKRWVINSLKKFAGRSKTTLDDVLISGFEKFVIPYVYILINFGIIDQLTLSANMNKAIDVAISVVTVFFGARFVNHALHVSLNLYMERRAEAILRVKQMNGILNVFKVLVWALGLLFLLDNLGYKVTTIITGLGIGGIAIALAAQNILSDLFSYFVIFFDKPFEIGDFVVAGTKSGTVEEIGIKTSRIRTVEGEELVMPNAELVKTPIHNYKRMEKRRVAFTIRVAYATAPEMLREIPVLIKNIITPKEQVLFERAHLQALADYFINFEVVYHMLTTDYNIFMDTHQAICLKILDAFKSRGIDFAIPAQAIYMNHAYEKEKEKDESPILLDPFGDKEK